MPTINLPKKNILLTGKPGTGKTTVIKKIIKRTAGKPGGFYTEEIREKGVRTGFSIKDINGKEGILSHCNVQSPFRVGKYGVNADEIDKIGVSAIYRAIENDETELIIIDEIASMELFSGNFQSAVLDALDSEKTVVGTIQQKQIPFLNSLRRRDDVTLITVTLENRDNLPDRILNLLSGKNS